MFAHISVMRGDARPVAGMAVRFVGTRDAQGRLRAEHMRGEGLALDRPAIRRKPQAARGSTVKTAAKAAPRRQAPTSRPVQPVRRAGLKLGVLALLCALPLAAACSCCWNSICPGRCWPIWWSHRQLYSVRDG
ncbi:hypothetical protein ULF88_09845 [Halopseudomonas pachastrellae]|nr:hypothetical protein [Halopseudomonas pachastrellae]